MSDTAIMNEMMKLEFKIDQILALNYKADVTTYRRLIGVMAKTLFSETSSPSSKIHNLNP